LRYHGLPFEIRLDEPNAETREAIDEVQRMKKDPAIGKTYTDVDAMMKELLA
jgi:DNA-damage-inducible protein J